MVNSSALRSPGTLAGEPRVLLLDESFNALDQPTRNALWLLVRELVDTQHLAALLATHDLDHIVHLADRVVLYEPGHTTATRDLPTDSANHVTRLLGPHP